MKFRTGSPRGSERLAGTQSALHCRRISWRQFTEFAAR